MKEKQNKSLTRRFVEGNKKFNQEIRATYIGCSVLTFIAGFIISYLLLENVEKTLIFNSIIISLIFSIISLISTFTIKPKMIFVLSVFISILISSIVRMF